MASLEDRLRALGVRMGAEELDSSRSRRAYRIESVVPGETVENTAGSVYLVRLHYPRGYLHGSVALQPVDAVDLLEKWLGEDLGLERAGATLFLDTETTGLSGGAGSLAFMVGLGRYTKAGFEVIQLFLRDPAEELPLLSALEEFLASTRLLVTFNGKSFDVPLLQSRYITNGSPEPFGRIAHYDLLQMARRLWRSRLPSRALSSLESYVLGLQRSEEDVPGWMIPQLYFDYLLSRDARPLRQVFYHNAMDIVSLAALHRRVSEMLADPLNTSAVELSDRVAIGRLCEEVGDYELASQIYRAAVNQDAYAESRLDAMRRLSFLYKRQSNIAAALELWQLAAALGEIYACVELAKHFEHRRRDFSEALRWTHRALENSASSRTGFQGSGCTKEELELRKARLVQKLARTAKESAGR